MPEKIQAETRETIEETTQPCVLRLFGAPPGAVQRAVAALPGESGVRARAFTRGGETLLVLEAGPGKNQEEHLRLAAQQLQAALAEAVYGRGEQTLPAAVVDVLMQRDQLLVCADAATGALLEPRLEALDGAERMFDFGAQSYLHPKNAARIAAAGPKWASRFGRSAETDAAQEPLGAASEQAAQQAIGRLQMARRLTEADLAAASLPLAGGQGTLLLLGRKKGLWLRVVPPGEAQNPALWLLDMIRRAAAGLEQAEGTRWARYGAPLPGLLAGEPGYAAQAFGQAEQAGRAPARENGESGQAGEPWVAERGERPPAADLQAEPNCTAVEKRPRHRSLRRGLRLLLVLLVLAAAAYAIWQYEGGSWEALRKSLGLKEFSLSGAELL